MGTLWVTVGVVVLLLTLVDVFLTALNYDEAGFFAGKLASWQWKFLRGITRRLSRRWRPVALRQVTGLQIMVTVFAWIGGIIVGYGLIYFGMMHGNNFLYDGVASGLYAAMYFSAAQLSTVGTSQVTPNTDILRALSIAETITSVVMVSLVLTFLLGVYQVISDLRALSANFTSSEPGSARVAETLAPFFPDGEPTGLDGHLQGISDSLSSYTDGLRLHHAAYYFQSGRDQFSLPFSMRMMHGTIGALRWGLPTGHPASQEPMLTQLGYQFGEFLEYLHPLIGWRSTDVPEIVPFAEFSELLAETESPSTQKFDTPSRLWVSEFLWLNHDMAVLTKQESPVDLSDAYSRYKQWLPFAYGSRQAADAVGHDLDYQPILSDPSPGSGGTRSSIKRPVLPAVPVPKPDGAENWWVGFWRRRVILIDPGMTRFLTALRSTSAALVTGIVLFVLLDTGATDAYSPAVFGAFMSMSSSVAFEGGRGLSRAPGFLSIIPIAIAIALSSIVPHSSLWTTLLMIILAMVGVSLGRFGKGAGGLGKLLFIAYYFTLLMHLSPADFPLYSIGAVVGVLVAFLVNVAIVPRKSSQVLRGGVLAFEQRLAMTLDPVIDSVSWARWDPDINKRVRVDLHQLLRVAAFLSGQLRKGNPESPLDEQQVGALRQRVFDAELAMVNLVGVARGVAGSATPVAARAALSGQLERLQQHIRSYHSDPDWLKGESAAETEAKYERTVRGDGDFSVPGDWPAAARRLHAAVFEVLGAIDRLHQAQLAELSSQSGDLSRQLDFSRPSHAKTPETKEKPEPSGYVRQAVQTGLSIGVALGLGSLISPTYQYWAALPAYQVLGDSDGETFIKAMQKIVGTVIGAAIGFYIAIHTEDKFFVVIFVLLVCIFATNYFRNISAPLTSFWQTMMFALLYEFLGKLSSEAVEIRVLETVVGAVVALLVAAIVLPTRTRTKLCFELAALTQATHDLVHIELARLGGGSGASRQERSALAAKLTKKMRQVEVTAAPLRRNSGSFESGGIEAKLTAVWSLVYYTRHLMAAVDEAVRKPVPDLAMDLSKAEAELEDNFAALERILIGELPGKIHESLSIPTDSEGLPNPPDVMVEALKYLDRINQTLLVLMANTAPNEVLARPLKQHAFVA